MLIYVKEYCDVFGFSMVYKGSLVLVCLGIFRYVVYPLIYLSRFACEWVCYSKLFEVLFNHLQPAGRTVASFMVAFL